MSSYGSYSLRLRQERLEQLRRRQEEQRKQQVRQEATVLLANGRRMIGQFRNNLVQHFGQKAQQESRSLAQRVEQLLQSAPEQALLLARRSVAAAERGLERASNKSAAWTKEKTEAQEAVTVFRLALDNLLGSNDTIESTDKEVASIAHQLAKAKVALKREDFNTAKAAAIKGQKHVHKVEQARQQAREREEVRREIVRGVRQVLAGMSFTVRPPHFGQDSESGKVILVGTLPSGRTARFAISPDRMVDYNFNGYHHRKCADHMKEIHRLLEKHCQAETSDIEVHWKEDKPLQNGKDALDLPAGQDKKLS